MSQLDEFADLQDEEGMVVECDGFITPEHRRGSLSEQVQRTFQYMSLPFVKVLLGLRRKGVSMGKIWDGRLLTERDMESAETELDMKSDGRFKGITA